jgi:probable rRNA maturation factor
LVILQRKVAGLSDAALERFALRARRAARVKGSVNVLVTSSATVQSLNRRFLGKNKATDVLSFPSRFSEPSTASKLAGDIAISADLAAQNAHTMGHSTAEEVKILTLHGILHLAGFDHERDNGQMARKELKLRRALRLPVGLIERVASASKPLNHRGHGEHRGRARGTS